MKNDSPLITLRFSDFMKPPSALAWTSTPAEVAIIAPDSARHSSPGPSWTRATAKPGLWRTATSTTAPPIRLRTLEGVDDVFLHRPAWYVLGPLIGLVVLGLLVAINE